jgi:tetratricopeptide (TPR) repeat protein
MTATRTPAVRAVVLAVALALGRLAAAQPSPAPDDRANADEAAALYDEGKRHFDIGEYAQAIASWKQSYLRSSAPLLLFNIAQAYRLSGNCAQANRFYLNYRRVEKHPKNPAELDKAMARCAGVEPATGDAAGESPPASAAGSSGGPAAGTADSPSTGAHLAAVTAPGAPATEPPPAPPASGAAAAPSSAAPADRVVAASSPAVPGRPAAEPTAGRSWRITGIVTGTAGVAALAAGGLYALAAKQDSDTVAGSRVGTPYTGDLVSTDGNGRTAASRARVLAGIGAALAVAGGAMWYIGRRQSAQLDVAIAPGHAEVALSCAF